MSCLRVDRLLAAAALWVGALASVPAWQQEPSAFSATVALIGVNAVYSLWTLTRSRRILVCLNCAQLVLFGLLSAQLASAFGDEHFHFDRTPHAIDWAQFILAHVLRAADVLDAIETYGIYLQMISHRSTASGLIIVGMHLTHRRTPSGL